jgi:hypothetical protein
MNVALRLRGVLGTALDEFGAAYDGASLPPAYEEE